LADIDGFDLDRSTAQAWSEFQSRLGEVISMIDDTGDLTIGTASVVSAGAPYLRFSSPRRDVIRCEAPSNADLDPRFHMTTEQESHLLGEGWESVGSADGAASYRVEERQDNSERVAQLAVSALRDVFGVKHPVFLAPDQLAEILQPGPAPVEAVVPGPGDERVAGDQETPGSTALAPRGRPHLDQLVDAELTHLLGYHPIRDTEGDVAIRVGSTMLFLRTSEDGREVIIFAALVHDVGGRSRAAEVLNDLNVAARWVKFQLVRDRVFVTMSVQAAPFVPTHLRQALRIVADVADGIDDELAAKLNGRTTFSDHRDA
jgi:hypothetical protein